MSRSTDAATAAVAVLLLAAVLIVPTKAAAAVPVDTDGDGYDDATELANGYTPFGAGRLDTHDADQDYLSDADELLFGTDPLEKDTDRDAYEDGLEVLSGYDPAKGNGARLKKRVRISLASQTLTYSIGPKALGVFPVSTGRPGRPTPIGTFTINNKIPRAWSRSAKLWMPYWMPFIGTTYGIHELPEWPGGKKEGENHLGTPVSSGCVRLGVGAAKTLYEWVEVGTEVSISKT